MSALFAYKLGEISLRNRIVMAPMTRTRAIDNVPNALMAKYYAQRSESGLIITEGTSPSPNGLGYPRIPGAYSDEQIAGWKAIAEAVHARGGRIFVQLMHTGRVSAQINMPAGAEILAPSAIRAEGQIFSESGLVDHDVPREMTIEEVVKAQEEFAYSAGRLVLEAGVDGVELHAANGYLPNQFLNPKSNQRTDDYGGSIENRCRFVIRTIRKMIDKVGPGRVGIRVSPYGSYNDMQGTYEDAENTYAYLAEQLGKLQLAYMHIGNPIGEGADEEKVLSLKKRIKSLFDGTAIVGGDVDSLEKANALLEDGFDLVYVGRPYISNPDLINRFRHDLELAIPDSNTFFGTDEVGYTDYDVMALPV